MLVKPLSTTFIKLQKWFYFCQENNAGTSQFGGSELKYIKHKLQTTETHITYSMLSIRRTLYFRIHLDNSASSHIISRLQWPCSYHHNASTMLDMSSALDPELLLSPYFISHHSDPSSSRFHLSKEPDSGGKPLNSVFQFQCIFTTKFISLHHCTLWRFCSVIAHIVFMGFELKERLKTRKKALIWKSINNNSKYSLSIESVHIALYSEIDWPLKHLYGCIMK